MGRRILWSVLGCVVLCLIPLPVEAQPFESVLILDNIPAPYRLGKVEKVFAGEPAMRIGGPKSYASPGIVGPTGHFPESDTTYDVTYFADGDYPSPTVQITLHSSTQWLGHEVEVSFRSEKTLDATFSAPNPVREIDGQRIFQLKRRAYSWVSGGNKVVNITYTDLTGTKPEPIEIIQAYLAKYPSSITLSNDEAKSASHTESWLKNEMERRVWLMEKWVSVGSADVLKQAEAERAILEHAEVFSKYMYKYLGDSPNELIKGFFLASRPPNWAKLAAEVSKLRTWWDSNKTRPLLISGIPSGFRLAEGWPVLLGGLGAARELWLNRGRVSGYLGRWFTKER